MSHKRTKKAPRTVKCPCGRSVEVGPKGYMAPHVTPAGRSCLLRHVYPQRGV